MQTFNSVNHLEESLKSGELVIDENTICICIDSSIFELNCVAPDHFVYMFDDTEALSIIFTGDDVSVKIESISSEF